MKNNKMIRIFFLLLAVSFPSWAEDAPAVASAGNHFDVLEYRVEGNSVLATLAIEEAVYPYLGMDKSVDDVEHARESLEKAYHDAGYLTVLVDIPEQNVEGGLVSLKVTEGKVGRTRVVGSHYFSHGRIRDKTPSLAEGSVPYFPDVQKEVAALNVQSDRQVVQVLRAGKTPGTVDVDLMVEDHAPLHGSLDINNHKSANTTPWRLSGMLRYDNLWQGEHSISLQYQTSPENTSEVKVLSTTYVMPLENGDTLAMYAVRSRSNVAVLGETSVLGNGNIYGIRRIIPLPARKQFFQSISLGADYKDFKESILFGSDTLATPISYLPFVVSYNASALADESITQMSLSANFSLRGIGNTPGEFAEKRYLAQPNYFYLKGDASYKRKVFGDSSLTVKLGGQLANQPLIGNEQFSAGGADSVRGYMESAALGDNALLGGLELSTPSLADALPDSVEELRLLAFAEGAFLRVKDALPNPVDGSITSHYILSSAGIGMRFKAIQHLTASLDVGWPFKDTASTHGSNPRVHFKMVYEF